MCEATKPFLNIRTVVIYHSYNRTMPDHFDLAYSTALTGAGGKYEGKSRILF
jgi:hypothetical protein